MANKSRKQDAKQTLPPQKQSRQPGRQKQMRPQPKTISHEYRGSGKLRDKVALITGGDSGIGRAVAVAFAREGADVAIVYLEETEDAQKTRTMVEAEGRRCMTVKGDVSRAAFCERVVQQTVDRLGRLDVLVNNAAVQHPQKSITDIDEKQLTETFRTNIFSMFFIFITKAALPHLRRNGGGAIINSTSVTAYRGSPGLIDYSSTKGAIVSFTRSLALSVVKEGIRVNAVAPGPIWTPLIPSTFPKEKVKKFGGDVPMERPGQPEECAPCYVFLASGDSSYMTGQVLHPNGGEIING